MYFGGEKMKCKALLMAAGILAAAIPSHAITAWTDGTYFKSNQVWVHADMGGAYPGITTERTYYHDDEPTVVGYQQWFNPDWVLGDEWHYNLSEGWHTDEVIGHYLAEEVIGRDGEVVIPGEWHTQTTWVSYCVDWTSPSAPYVTGTGGWVNHDVSVSAWGSWDNVSGIAGYGVNTSYVSNEGATGVYAWAWDAAGNYSGTTYNTIYIDKSAPSIASNFGAGEIGSNYISLSWNAASDAYSGLAGYNIFRNGSLLATLGSSATSYIDNGLSNLTDYTYYLEAVDNIGWKSSTGPLSLQTVPEPTSVICLMSGLAGAAGFIKRRKK